jgi:hypothetical protein
MQRLHAILAATHGIDLQPDLIAPLSSRKRSDDEIRFPTIRFNTWRHGYMHDALKGQGSLAIISFEGCG